MEQLKIILQKILSEKTTIDWLIVHEISKQNIKVDGIEFSFVDGKERLDEPFKTCQGYISLKNDSAIKGFDKIVAELSDYFKDNLTALSNLFIINTRTSYKGEDKEIILKHFKKKIRQICCAEIFANLIDSLNTEYYKDTRFKSKNNFTSLNEWLEIFQSAQYTHSISDPLLDCLFLVREEHCSSINYDLFQDMKPLMRAVLIEQYGFTIEMSDTKLKEIHNNQYELSFLSAYLIDESQVPNWVSQELISIFINNHWKNIGEQFFIHIFGLSYKNKNQNELNSHLADLMHNILSNKILNDSAGARELIKMLEFPKDFIALFYWFHSKQIEINTIPDAIRVLVLEQFIGELQRIRKVLPAYFASEHSTDPFSSFQLNEQKYQMALAYLLWFLLFASNEHRKQLKNIFYEFKPLFYGGFRAYHLAMQFAELMLLIGLSVIHLNELDTAEWDAIKKYLSIIEETILIPYIHLAERNSEIWDMNSKKELHQYQAGLYLINEYLCQIRSSGINKHYLELFSKIDEIKVAEWRYENISLFRVC
jgi:hypothetical protein